MYILFLQFALFVLVALVVCAMAQWPYYGGIHYNALAYPYAYGYNAYGYNAYNPALSYLWKK